ncbi:sensor histidine kinase [Pseudoalteromonas sp. T1lg10]|uniref:sensor histidine kinase n=1 Tax=Pseudoalteromonas sp. T1lg10 TaxID=2077093 RepID=UPI000CF617DD|nr:ATP-binding protein [Pseudoalteromonas sp. T1lg10]
MNEKQYHKFLSFKYFEYIIGLCLTLFIAALVFVVLAFVSKSEQQKGLEQNFNLVRLSQELRLSSDQLTMMARAYAATTNPKFKEFFEQILSIRSGESPRPKHLNRVYWDMLMVADGSPPFLSDEPKSLLDLLKENGASEQELTALTHAYDQSESLVLLENQAFDLVRQGKNQEALAILYSEAYLQSKVRIMRHINEFLSIREQKLGEFIAYSTMKLNVYYFAAVVCFLSLLCVLIFFYNARSRIRKNIISFLNSEVKNQTNELVSKNNALCAAVSDLEQVQARLVNAEKSATLMRLIPGLAHEINTPVGIAVTASSSQLLALEEVKACVNENKLAKKSLLESIESIENCANLVGNSASRISNIMNKLKVITQYGFDEKAQMLVLADEIRACVEDADNKGMHVELDIEVDEHIQIEAPRFLLHLPLAILIENSFNHAFEHPSTQYKLHIQASLTNQELTIRVCDNGCGIPDAIKGNLFDTLVVGNRDATVTELGLCLAHEIISQYFCGTLEYKSHCEGGACFAITMPLDGFRQSTAKENGE